MIFFSLYSLRKIIIKIIMQSNLLMSNLKLKLYLMSNEKRIWLRGHPWQTPTLQHISFYSSPLMKTYDLEFRYRLLKDLNCLPPYAMNTIIIDWHQWSLKTWRRQFILFFFFVSSYKHRRMKIKAIYENTTLFLKFSCILKT